MRDEDEMRGKFLSDRKVAALLFLLGALFAIACLQAQMRACGCPYLTEHEIFGRAVMVASGRGFVWPPAEAIPGLDDFLAHKTASFDPRSIPPEVKASSWDESVSGYHRYLVYAIGLTWRLLGISWASIQYLMGILFGATIAIGYGLLRLGMNRLVSFLGAVCFMLSPAMLAILPRVRDFSKAPFVLGAVLIMGGLAKGPVTVRAYLGLAGLLGLVMGVGMGFRQDAMICLPPAVVVVGLMTCGESRLSIPRRTAAVALLLACFVVAAWPMLHRMDSGGAQPYHPIVQGFCTEMRDNLGLGMAGYEPLSRGDDNFVFSTLCSYDQRVNGGSDDMTYNSPAAVQTGKQWILETARTFPADVITRAYAALLWALGDGGMQAEPNMSPNPWGVAILAVARPLSIHLYHYGIWYLVLALLILSSRSLRLSGLLLFFLLYFCGYVSLEFQFRHTFHLCLTPLWVLGFLIEALIQGVGGLRHAEVRTRLASVLLNPRRWWTPPMKRVLLFSAGASMALFVPLYAARAYQHAVVGDLLQQYAAAPLEPVETVQEHLGDWTLFRPSPLSGPVTEVTEDARHRPGLPFYAVTGLLSWYIACTPIGGNLICNGVNALLANEIQFRNRQWETHTGYLVAELAATSKERLLLLKYESESSRNNFSQLTYVAAVPSGCGTVKYFFPVYELCILEEGQIFWDRFAGIGLPQEQVADLKALYRVEHTQDFRLLLNLTLPQDLDSFQRHQALVMHTDFAHRFACAEKAGGWLDRADAKRAAGDTDEALMLYRAALALEPKNASAESKAGELFAEKGDAEAAKGNTDAAIRAYEAGLCFNPNVPLACDKLDALLQTRNDPAGRATIWRRIAAAQPDNNGWLQKTFAVALFETDAYAEALPVLQKLLQQNPMNDESRGMLVKALLETGRYDAAWEEAAICRNRGVGLPPELIQALEDRSARTTP